MDTTSLSAANVPRPAQPWTGPVDRHQRFRLPIAALGVLIVAAVAITDLCTASLNLAILYCLPMALFARTARPATIWRVACLLVLLGYAGYFFGPWADDSHTWHEVFFRVRTVNRTIAAGSILAIASMSHLGIVLRRRMDSWCEPQNVREADRDVFLEAIDSFEQFQAAGMALVTVIGVAAADFVTAAQFNPSIVYAVPVLACMRTRSRTFLWCVVAVVIGLVYAGFRFGSHTGLDADHLARVARNREVTAWMVLGMGVFTHLLIDVDYPRARRARGSKDNA